MFGKKNFNGRTGPASEGDIRPVASWKSQDDFHIRVSAQARVLASSSLAKHPILAFSSNNVLLFSLLLLLTASDSFLSLRRFASHHLVFFLTDDASQRPASRHIIIDQQRMKERLGVIVRAKESKMVNVNAPLPFNLTTNGNKQPRISRLHTGSPQPSLDMERQSAVSSASASVSASHELDEDTRRSTLHDRRWRRVRNGGRRGGVAAAPNGGGSGGGGSITDRRGGACGYNFPFVVFGLIFGAAAGTRAGAGVGVGGVAQIPCTAFKIQNIGSLSRSWGD
ncbi:hypothetical protein V8E52_009011 [Russula decolorans]